MALLTLKFVTDIRDMDYEVIEFHGELDQSNLTLTETQVADLLKSFSRKFLVFDLADLSFINSEGVGFIVSISTKLARKNQKILSRRHNFFRWTFIRVRNRSSHNR